MAKIDTDPVAAPKQNQIRAAMDLHRVHIQWLPVLLSGILAPALVLLVIFLAFNLSYRIPDWLNYALLVQLACPPFCFRRWCVSGVPFISF
jgi:hypothetical protein